MLSLLSLFVGEKAELNGHRTTLLRGITLFTIDFLYFCFSNDFPFFSSFYSFYSFLTNDFLSFLFFCSFHSF